MPGFMMHLNVARHYAEHAKSFGYDTSTAFFIGSLAPDTITERTEKDRTHFRDRDDRLQALIELATQTDRREAYAEGVLLHLYTDYLWDNSPVVKDFIKNIGGFTEYRQELGIAGANAFHRVHWADGLFREILACEMPAELRAVIERSYLWHSTNNLPDAEVFTPEVVDAFSLNAARLYMEWRNNK